MKMKRVAATILSGAMAVSLAACGVETRLAREQNQQRQMRTLSRQEKELRSRPRGR